YDIPMITWTGGFPSGLDSVRGTRHHGLVERVHRDRNRINSPHCRPIDKHGRSPYGAVYLSPPPDNNWRSVIFSFILCSIFPSPEQNPGLSHYQSSLNTGGSLPDLSNLHFPSPLSTPLDPEDNTGYPNLSGGSSTGNLPAAMMHLGISNTQGGWSTAFNSPRRRPAPISPLTLSPGAEQRRGLTKQLSPTMSPSLSPITQVYTLRLSAIAGDLRKRSPTIICFSLSDDSNPSLSKDISSTLSTVPECFDSEEGFPLEDELRIEPLSLDGLSMLSDPNMVLTDPSVEATFRSDRL
uniref:Uncharacterized protein n=1 Tax=Monopterus albus TaxID=43700 RepID=A0A3Q3J6B4_MONAL